MIGWLKGEKIEYWVHGTRSGVIISCSGVGYEVQTLCRNQSKISESKELTLWIHQIQREDGVNLYGFKKKSDRNLFRLLTYSN